MLTFTNNRCSTAVRWLSGFALATSTLVAGTAANGGTNTRAADPVFNEPAQGGMKQIALGIGDVVIAYLLYPESVEKSLDVTAEEKEYQFALDKPTSETERQAKLAELAKDSENPRTAERIERLNKAAILSDEEKVQAVKESYANLMQANSTAARTTANGKKLLPKAIRGLRYLGTAAFTVDVVSRPYIWIALDADPTFSPVVTYLRSMSNR